MRTSLFPAHVVEEVVVEAARSVDARLYEDPYCEELRGRLADFLGIDTDEVMVASGADGVIELAAWAKD